MNDGAWCTRQSDCAGPQKERKMPDNVKRRRKRVKQVTTLGMRLARAAEEYRREARFQTSAAKREALLRAARNCEVTAHLDEWLSSPGLQLPA